MLEVLIENETGKNIKNFYNETTCDFIKSVTVSRPYPFPYGFVPDTTAGDGYNLDVFVLTNRQLATGKKYQVNPIGVLRQTEDDEQDDNILAVFEDEDFDFDENVKDKLVDFINNVFNHLDKDIEALEFDDREAALRLIEESSGKVTE